MSHFIYDLEKLLEHYYPLLSGFTTNDVAHSTTSWSSKQELGHLVDSAQNNIQRFVRVQYQPSVKISYNPDEWVRINDYENMPWSDLVKLWYLLNKQVVRILKNIPEDAWAQPVDVGAQDAVIHPLSFIAEDYGVHMKHHLDHILAAQPGTA